ncbi:MAG: hypothetical protein AVDCRST_MAG49-4531, partial [uncultured Thermomicrobiales bacterium]
GRGRGGAGPTHRARAGSRGGVGHGRPGGRDRAPGGAPAPRRAVERPTAAL